MHSLPYRFLPAVYFYSMVCHLSCTDISLEGYDSATAVVDRQQAPAGTEQSLFTRATWSTETSPLAKLAQEVRVVVW